MEQGFSYPFYFSLILGLYLTGLIWTVQWVHYPSFHFIGADKFKAFCEYHQAHMTHVVGPVMVLEMIAGVLLVRSQPSSVFVVLLVLVGLIWLSTFLVSVPIHTELLNSGYSKELVNKLVLTNWPRTLLWTLKSAIMFYIVFIKWRA